DAHDVHVRGAAESLRTSAFWVSAGLGAVHGKTRAVTADAVQANSCTRSAAAGGHAGADTEDAGKVAPGQGQVLHRVGVKTFGLLGGNRAHEGSRAFHFHCFRDGADL